LVTENYLKPPTLEQYAMTMDHEQESFASRNPKEEREVIVSVIAEHLASLEKASLVLAYSIQRQRALLEELKVLEGWDWQVSAPSALFGDAVLFQDCEVAVLQRTDKPGGP
jgi:hypothetical protein